MNKTPLKTALVQELNHGDAQANLRVIEQRVTEAAAAGAKLVLLQELHNGAYFCQHESSAEFDRAESIPGPSTERLSVLAANTGVVLVASLFEPVPQHRRGFRSKRTPARQIPQNAYSG
jgi:N-carbamoylputrescine amidase